MHPPRKKKSINSKYVYPYVTTKLENYYNWLKCSFVRFRLQVFSLCTSRPLAFLRRSLKVLFWLLVIMNVWFQHASVSQEVFDYTNTILAPHLPYTPDLVLLWLSILSQNKIQRLPFEHTGGDSVYIASAHMQVGIKAVQGSKSKTIRNIARVGKVHKEMTLKGKFVDKVLN